jgi:hypothetical protein
MTPGSGVWVPGVRGPEVSAVRSNGAEFNGLLPLSTTARGPRTPDPGSRLFESLHDDVPLGVPLSCR